jgi:hypothetical protein
VSWGYELFLSSHATVRAVFSYEKSLQTIETATYTTPTTHPLNNPLLGIQLTEIETEKQKKSASAAASRVHILRTREKTPQLPQQRDRSVH